MRLRLAVVVFCLLAVLASHVGQGSGASAGSNAGRQADLAGIEKFHQRDIASAVLSDLGVPTPPPSVNIVSPKELAGLRITATLHHIGFGA